MAADAAAVAPMALAPAFAASPAPATMLTGLWRKLRSSSTRYYIQPREHHNPIETDGTVAHWQGDNLTLYDTKHWPQNYRG
jgi:hypothetical protein